jgi:hypothetical protein
LYTSVIPAEKKDWSLDPIPMKVSNGPNTRSKLVCSKVHNTLSTLVTTYNILIIFSYHCDLLILLSYKTSQTVDRAALLRGIP